MTPSRDPTTLICGGLYILLALYAAGLWAFALFRTGMAFCYFFIVAAVFSAFISVVTVAMYLDPYIGVRLLGPFGWRISYYFIIVVQPVALLIGVTGSTILVRWLTKRSNQSLEPTAGRRDDQI
jgi:hypothetical protein